MASTIRSENINVANSIRHGVREIYQQVSLSKLQKISWYIRQSNLTYIKKHGFSTPMTHKKLEAVKGS